MRRVLKVSAVAAVLSAGGVNLASVPAWAQSVPQIAIGSIAIEGNQRIERESILSYIRVNEGETASASDINESVRELFATGLFKDVRIEPVGSSLRVIVEENPIVNQIAIEGNDRIPDEAIISLLNSRERRVFTRAKAEADAELILEQYRRGGRYSASVEPKIIELPQNRVNLVFEVEEGPVTSINSIGFVGNTMFSDWRLRRVISTDETSIVNFLSQTDTYDPDRIEFDKNLLERFYNENGFPEFEVSSAVAEIAPDQSEFFLTFTIDEGEQFRFGSMDVVSNAEGVNTDDLARAITISEGAIYDVRDVDESIAAMKLLLGANGFAFTDIKPIPTFNSEGRTVGIKFEVNEGERVFVERINIEGNTRTLDRVVRREFELAEGDAFDALQVRRSRANIRGLGFFDTVAIEAEEGSAPDRVVLTTEVQERSTGQINFGIGFSTSEDVSGEVSIVERNLLGRGQFLRARARLSGSNSQFDLSFTEPAFLDRDVAVGFDAYRRETSDQDTSSFDTRNTGFSPRISFPLGKFTRFAPRYRISEDSIIDVPANASQIIRRDIGTEITSSLGYTLTHDRRNDAVEPSKGFYAQFSQDVAGLGGDTKYLLNRGKIKGYQRLFADGIIGTVELEGGAIVGFSDYDPTVSDRFFLGGDSFRGFENGGIGPEDKGDKLGGNVFGIMRAEVTFPLPLPDELGLSGGFFTDVGTVYDLDDVMGDDGIVDDSANIRATVGASIFWRSPLGPVRFNFATPLASEDGDDEEFFRFTAGTRF